MKERLRLICGSLERSDGPLRTAADLYLSRIVSCTPASRLPAASPQSALLFHKRKMGTVTIYLFITTENGSYMVEGSAD